MKVLYIAHFSLYMVGANCNDIHCRLNKYISIHVYWTQLNGKLLSSILKTEKDVF